jgi:CheY-like chemotaxis protein
MNEALDNAHSAIRGPATPHERPTIAVIDDDASMRALVRFHLSSAGYEVLEGGDGIEGTRLVIERQPDLVICDVNMPHGNSYDLVTTLKSNPATRAIPVVCLTADAKEQAGRLGVAAYLRKPVSAHRLLQVVEILAGSQKSLAEDAA